MKALFLCALALAVCHAVRAEDSVLGLTLDQCKARLGAPAKLDKQNGFVQFKTVNQVIQLHFYKGSCEEVECGKAESAEKLQQGVFKALKPDEQMELLKLGGTGWEPVRSTGNTWEEFKTEKGQIAFYDTEAKVLRIMTRDGFNHFVARLRTAHGDAEKIGLGWVGDGAGAQGAKVNAGGAGK